MALNNSQGENNQPKLNKAKIGILRDNILKKFSI